MQTRRQFIKDTTTIAGGAGLGLALSPRILAESKGAAERVVFGLIGCGTMSRENMRHFLELNQPVAAVGDVDEAHLEHAAGEVVKAGQAAPSKFKDFRQLLEQKDIDAVIIGTPDHWHAAIFITACEAGKDIYPRHRRWSPDRRPMGRVRSCCSCRCCCCRGPSG